jgi:hypothetical protein
LIAGCWSIWIQRNNMIFEHHNRDLWACFDHFKVSISTIRHKIKPSLKEGLQDWLDHLWILVSRTDVHMYFMKNEKWHSGDLPHCIYVKKTILSLNYFLIWTFF